MIRQRLVVTFDERKVDAIFAELNQSQLPGAAVGIAVDGKPVYRKGFGLASMELPVLLSPSIRMRIHSASKHFACLAYMLLCEAGRAGVDDPIEKYIPELHPTAHGVTIRQLMGHIGGLRDAHDINWLFSGAGRHVSSADVLSLYHHIDDVNFAPGTAWCYNNGGYLLLSVAIERISGRSFEEELRASVFEPVGLNDTLVRRWDTDFVPNSATMHTKAHAGYERSYLGTASAGEGGIVSTVDDMLRWLAHMDAPWVGNAATWTVMKASQTLANGTSTGYGLGLYSSLYRGVETIQHAGGGMGSNSQMLKVPAAGLDIAIMVNRDDVSSILLANRVLDVCLLDLEPLGKGSRRSVATGLFRSPTTARVIQLCTSSATSAWSEGQQPLASIDGTDIPIEPDDDALRPAGAFEFLKLRMTLTGDPSHPDSIRLSDFGNPDELVAVPSVDGTDPHAIMGRYRSERTGTDATIVDNQETPRLTTVGRFGAAEFKLKHLAGGVWRAISKNPTLGGVLSFDTERIGFRFSSLRTRLLPFRRCA